MALIPPDIEQLKEIEQQIKEYKANEEEDIDRILDWLALQPHLPKLKDRKRIKRFLVGCKFSIEKTKQSIDYYYTVRGRLPNIFRERDPLLKLSRQAFEDSDVFPLPKMTREGYRIMYFKLTAPDLDFSEYIKHTFAVLDILHCEDQSIGYSCLVDACSLTSSHLISYSALGITTIKNCIDAFAKAHPMRVKNIVYVNAPSLIESFISLFKPFLPKKIADRITIFSKGDPLEKLFKIIPQEILPKEFGGDAPPLQEIREYWKEKVESYRDWLIAEQDMMVDESKRPDSVHDNEFGGVDGTFRKLGID